MFRGLAMAGQYFFPLVFVFGAIGSIFARFHRRRLLSNAATALKPAQVLDGISWHDFELLVGEVFRSKGYSVLEQGGAGPDGGVDLVLRKAGETYLVQCKHWRSMQVGVVVVREFFGVIAAAGAIGGYIVASGRFTDEARRFASGRNIELIDGEILRDWISVQKTKVFQKEQSPSCPICHGEMVRRIARKGPNAGGSFLGCQKYPACKGIINI
jgi:restriction system protein